MPLRIELTCCMQPERAPRWVYLLNGMAGLVYLHLDCIDGKQARRTGSSSPLGQLFDHGDSALPISCICHLISLSVASPLSQHVCLVQAATHLPCT